MTGSEAPPVGDAREVPRTLVRRLDKLCRFTLKLFFPSATVPINNYLSCFCWVKKKSDRVWVGRVAQALLGSDNAFSAVERGDRVFVPVSFPEFPWFQDFNATIRNNSTRRLLAAAFGSALSAAGVDHPVRCVLSTVLGNFRTSNSIRRPLSAAIGSELSSGDIEHPVRCVVCTVLGSFF